MIDESKTAHGSGATPLDDISGLIPRHIRTRAELNAAEAENISRVFPKYLAARPSPRIAPFNLKWACRLHRQMFGEVWKWANIMLKQDFSSPTEWPENKVGTSSDIRSEYIEAVRAADRGELDPLIKLHLRYTRQ